MLLDRGTKTQDKFTITRLLDEVGADISFSVGRQTVEIRAKCLKKDFPLVMGLIADELRNPALSQQEFIKAKQQFIGMLQESKQNTEVLGQQALARMLFPVGHPNHPASIDEYLSAASSATLEELTAFHARHYGPSHLTLVLVGDVDMDRDQSVVAKAFSGWSGGEDFIRPAVPTVSPGPRELSVPLAGKPSVTVFLGQATGLRYKDPDALALRVGTAIFGRGFTGRLMSRVRDKEGLTYDIGASVSEDTVADGAWDISASFAPSLLEKGIAATRRELHSWWQDGVTAKELEERKQGIIGGYYVGLSTTAGLANTILLSVQRGYDLGWLDVYPDAVNALTLTQVNAAIKSHLNPDTMVLVKAGSVPPPPP
jgi:zinc protease